MSSQEKRYKCRICSYSNDNGDFQLCYLSPDYSHPTEHCGTKNLLSNLIDGISIPQHYNLHLHTEENKAESGNLFTLPFVEIKICWI